MTNPFTEYSLSWVYPVRIQENSGYVYKQTDTRRVIAGHNASQRWELQGAVRPFSGPDNTLAQINAHYHKFQSHTSFPVPMPQITNHQFVAGGNDVYAIAKESEAGSDTITLSDLPLSLLIPGHFVSFTGHTKVYQVTAAVIDENGDDIVTIYPDLIADVPKQDLTTNTVSQIDMLPELTVVYDPDLPHSLQWGARAENRTVLSLVELP